MDDRWDEVAGTRRGRKRSGRSRDRDRKRSRHRDRDDDREMASRRPRKRSRVRMTEEQKVYQAARRRANRKLSFISHFVSYATVCTFLLFIAGFKVATIVALSWGIGIVFHYFFALAAPELRQRLIDREVNREVQVSVSRERRSIEEKNARQIEQLSASIAHEIRNPITAAKSLVQQMEEEPTAGENVEYARVALEELHRVEQSVSHLLRFAREERTHIERVKMADVVDSALETFRDRLARTGVRLEKQVDCVGELSGDPEQLRRIVINLVGNAIDALAESATPEPRIDVQMGENLAGSEVWLRIRDNGPGLDRELLAKMFSPFYTSKVNGTGLGLAICKKLVDAHAGSIEVTSEPGDGAEFIVTFPKVRNEQGVSL